MIIVLDRSICPLICRQMGKRDDSHGSIRSGAPTAVDHCREASDRGGEFGARGSGVEVARRRDMHRNLLTVWRRQARAGAFVCGPEPAEVHLVAVSAAPEQQGFDGALWNSSFSCRLGASSLLSAGEIVLSERAHMRVDKDIGIDQYHLKPSPSAMASASPILSMLAIRTRPSATARVRMTSRGLRRLPISSRPRRSASLIRRFRLI